MSFPLYKQTTECTCGPASVMVVLKHLGKLKKFSRELEFNIWRSVMIFPFKGSTQLAMASFLARKRLKVTLVAEKKFADLAEFNTGFKWEKIPKAWRSEYLDYFKMTKKIYLKDSKEAGVKFLIKKPSVQILREGLKRGKLAIILLNANYFHRHTKKINKNYQVPHYVVAFKIDAKNIHLMDPYVGKIKMDFKDLAGAMNSLYKVFKIRPALIFINKR